MKELKRKENLRRSMYSVPSLVFLTILTFFLVKGAIGIMHKKQENLARVKELELMASSLSAREEELNTNIQNLRTEEGMNEEIRGKFSVTREGEHVAVIVDEKRQATSTDAESLPWYKRVWSVIMR